MAASASAVYQTGGNYRRNDYAPFDSTPQAFACTLVNDGLEVPNGNLVFTNFDFDDTDTTLSFWLFSINFADATPITEATMFLQTSSASTDPQSYAGSAQWTGDTTDLNGVDPTDPTFSVVLTSITGGTVEIISMSAQSSDSTFPLAPENISLPVVTSDGFSVLTATPGVWSGNPAPSSFTYLWSSGETTPTKTLTTADVNTAPTVTVTAVSPTGSAHATSVPIGPFLVPAIAVEPSTTIAVDTGGLQSVLKVSNGTLQPNLLAATYTYSWTDGSTITKSVLTSSMIGTTQNCNVTITNAVGQTGFTAPCPVTSSNIPPLVNSLGAFSLSASGLAAPTFTYFNATAPSVTNHTWSGMGTNPGNVATAPLTSLLRSSVTYGLSVTLVNANGTILVNLTSPTITYTSQTSVATASAWPISSPNARSASVAAWTGTTAAATATITASTAANTLFRTDALVYESFPSMTIPTTNVALDGIITAVIPETTTDNSHGTVSGNVMGCILYNSASPSYGATTAGAGAIGLPSPATAWPVTGAAANATVLNWTGNSLPGITIAAANAMSNFHLWLQPQWQTSAAQPASPASSFVIRPPSIVAKYWKI